MRVPSNSSEMSNTCLSEPYTRPSLSFRRHRSLFLLLFAFVFNHGSFLCFRAASLLRLVLLLFNEATEDSDLVILVLLKVESVLLTEPKLEQIVV